MDEINFSLNLQNNSVKEVAALRRELHAAATAAGKLADQTDRAVRSATALAAAPLINPTQRGGVGGGGGGGSRYGGFGSGSGVGGIGPPSEEFAQAKAAREALTSEFRAALAATDQAYEDTINRLRGRQSQLIADLQKQPNLGGYEKYRHELENTSIAIDRLNETRRNNIERGNLVDVRSEKHFEDLMQRNEHQARQFDTVVGSLDERMGHFNNQTLQKSNMLLDGFLTSMKHIAVAAVGWAAVGLLTDLVSGLNAELQRTIESAARMDRYRRSFTALMGAEGQGNLAQVISFSRQTPFDLEQSITQSQRLIATGMRWQEVIPTMHAAANAIARIAGGARQMEGLNKALIDVQTKGKLAGQEIIQFANAGVDILSILASQLKITRGEVLALSEDGKISGEQVLASFRNWSRAQGDFLKQQSTDYLGVQQNIQDVRFELEAAFGYQAMRIRTKSAQELLDAMSSPGARKTVEMWGKTFAIVETGLNVFLRGTINELELVSYLIAKVAGTATGSFYEYHTSIVAVNEGLAGTVEEVRNLANTNWEATINKEIDALKKQNDELDRQKQLRNALRSLSAAEADLAYTEALAIDLFNPVAISARASLPSKRENVIDRVMDVAEVRGRQSYENRLADLERQKLLGDPSVTALFGIPWGSYSWDKLPRRALGGPVSSGGSYVVGERGPEVLRMGSSSGYVSSSGGAAAGMVGYCMGCSQKIVLSTIESDRGQKAVGNAARREASR